MNFTLNFFLFLFPFLISLAFAIPISYDSDFIFKDSSSILASNSISGCSLKRPLNCPVDHADKGIRMRECWSNTRVRGQKFALFVPVDKNDPRNSYGDCIIYTCFPNSNDLQLVDNSSNICFFWNDKEQEVEQNDVGLHIQIKRSQDEEKDSIKTKRDKKITNNNDYITWVPIYHKREEMNDKVSSLQIKRTKKIVNTNYINWIPPPRKRDQANENSI